MSNPKEDIVFTIVSCQALESSELASDNIGANQLMGSACQCQASDKN